MPKAKKPGKCRTCGGAFATGDDIRFEPYYSHRRHPGNGVVLSSVKRYAVHHASLATCRDEKRRLEAERVEFCRAQGWIN